MGWRSAGEPGEVEAASWILAAGNWRSPAVVWPEGSNLSAAEPNDDDRRRSKQRPRREQASLSVQSPLPCAGKRNLGEVWSALEVFGADWELSGPANWKPETGNWRPPAVAADSRKPETGSDFYISRPIDGGRTVATGAPVRNVRKSTLQACAVRKLWNRL